MSVCLRALVSGLCLAVPVAAQGVKLNEPLARPIGGDVGDFAASRDGTRAAYIADQEHDEVFELFSVPADGSGPPVKLNGTLAPDARVQECSFSPDGAWVVFRVATFSGEDAVWSAPADGSFAAVQLGTGVGYAIAPDSERVVFIDAFTIDQGLYSSPIDGSAPRVQLTPPIPPGGGMIAFDPICLFTSDGDTVVYAARQESPDRTELFAVPTDGSAASRKLNGPLVAGGEVAVLGSRVPMAIAGERAVYVADQEVDERGEIFSVPLDGSAAPTKLNGPLVAGGSVASYYLAEALAVSADGTRVLYVADEEIDDAYGLYSAPVDGSGPSVSLTPGLPQGRVVEQYGFAPDGAHAYFVCNLRTEDRLELFRASADGSGNARRISGELAPGGDVSRFEVTADGNLVVYSALQNSIMDLYRVETDGLRRRRALQVGGPAPGGPVKISDGIIPSGSLSFATTADSAHVVIATGLQVYAAPLSSLQPPVMLDPEYSSNAGVSPLQLAGVERVVYLRGSYASFFDDPIEFFSARVDGSAPPVRLNDDLPFGPVLGDVFECDFSPRGDWVVYRADGDTDERFQLYVASTSGRRPTRKLSGESDPVAWFRTFHPDGERTLYLAHAPGAAFGYAPYLARLDGSTPPVLRGGPHPAGRSVSFADFTPDGTRLILSGDLHTQGRTELFNAPVDAGAPRFKLSPTLLPNESVQGVRIAPDGQHVLFTISSGGPDLRLFAVPTDRAQEPIALSSVAQGMVQEFEFSPDGQFALYKAFSSGSFDVYAAPVDGSAPSALLSAPTGSGFVTEFVAAPDSSRVVFRDESFAGTGFLLSAPLGGGAVATLFSTASTNSLSNGVVSLDSASVVFSASSPGFTSRLYRVPLDGSAAAVPLTALGEVGRDPHLTPDGVHVVYLGTGVGLGWGVFRRRLDGSGPLVRLSPPYVPFVDIMLDLSPDGHEAVYAVEGPQPGVDELWAVPVDGSRDARRLNRPQVDGRIVDDIDGPRFRISPTSHAVIYRAARENVKELFLSLLDSRVSPFGGEPPEIVR